MMSFIMSVVALVTLLLLLEFTHDRNTGYYNYSAQGIQSVGVTISKNPYQTGGDFHQSLTKQSTADAAPEIISDDVVDQNPDKTDATPATGDSATTSGQSAENGTGGVNSGNGIVGEVFGSVQVNPQFVGGIKAMQEYIRTNLQYPETARNMNISGVIHVYLVVKANGALADIKIVKSLHPDLDAEALRVVKSMPDWKPGMQGDGPVKVRLVLPIPVSPLK